MVNLARVECGEKTECAERIDSVDSTADSTESAFHHIPPNTCMVHVARAHVTPLGRVFSEGDSTQRSWGGAVSLSCVSPLRIRPRMGSDAMSSNRWICLAGRDQPKWMRYARL